MAGDTTTAVRSILVVENEVRTGQGIRASLLAFGYDVAPIAASRAEALAAVETYHPDLVLMDMCLEEGDDGIAAAAEIQARHPTPIVFLTEDPDEDTLHRAQEEAHPCGFVLKPYQDRDLRAVVETALQRHGLDQAVKDERSLLVGILSSMSDSVAVVDNHGNVVVVNDAAMTAFGEDTSDPTPKARFGRRVYLPDAETPFSPEALPIARALLGENVRDVEIFVRSSKLPEGRFYSMNAAPLLDRAGSICGAVEVARDVTEFRAARSELQNRSETDVLTGVFNRRGFMESARKALEAARRSGREPAVFFVDLNGMKRINDSLGHPEGDRLLLDVSWILRACFRASDIVGRLGGDEFVVFAPDAGEHADVLRERLRGTVDEFNAASGRRYRISVSIGLSRCGSDVAPSLEELVEQADRRMYEDKWIRSSRRATDAQATDAQATDAQATDPQMPEAQATRPVVPAAAAPRRSRIPPPPSDRASGSLPPGPDSPAGSHAALRGPLEQPARKRLLLVDDDPRILSVLERMLAPLGHELVRAEDGPSALAALAKSKPDLVVLDLVMPGPDGLELLRHIRANEGPAHVPVLLLTAHSERDHRQRGLEAGADDFLEKPADARTLRARVSTLLGLKETRDALLYSNQALNARNADLRHLQRDQRELTALVVHDLKNPIAAVWSNLEFARETPEAARSEVDGALADAGIACRQLRSMVDDLLVISRVEESALSVRNEGIVISDLLWDVISSYAPSAARRHIHLSGPERTGAEVRTDRALLERIVANVLDSALRHTPEKGRVSVTTRANGLVEILVSSTGPAVPVADRERVFKKFARVDVPCSVLGHNGLGLYFCKCALDALGGHIELTETTEWPTSFVVQLPARRAETLTDRSRRGPSPVSTASRGRARRRS